MQKKKINLCIIADGSATAFIGEADIGALFGNILDNAIEAVENMELSDRMISLNVSQKKGFLYIHEDNRCDDRLTFADGIPQTLKSDTDIHGFGTKSIKLIAEKYGGKALMACSDGVFSLDIVIPISN